MKLRSSKRALHQIDEVLGYLAEQSPQGASNVAARLATMLDMLRLYPHVGARTRISGVRRLILVPYPYAIDYIVGTDEIVILRFRHTARRPIP